MCLNNCACYVLLCFLVVNAAELKCISRDELLVMAEQIETIKALHLTDITRLRREVQELQQAKAARDVDSSTPASCDDLEQQLHAMRSLQQQMMQSMSESTITSRQWRARSDAVDVQVSRLQRELREARSHLIKLAIEVKQKPGDFLKSYNEVLGAHANDNNEATETEEPSHRLRHSKLVRAQVSHLAHAQHRLDDTQHVLRTHLLDLQNRLENLEQTNWTILMDKLQLLELENKRLREEIINTSQKVSDFDKVHASLLELREDIEGIENKADKTVPEFRKEISKLDISFAQLNAASSYLKEDQENLRQSVKAIAVSVSNEVERAARDHHALRMLNATTAALEARTRVHYYKLNDHILKSESQNGVNLTDFLPEIMVEVKELQPVQHKYEELINQLPKECSTIVGPTGTYLIHPGHTPVETWCYNGSTLLQRRINGSVEFNRKFSEYVHGFGSPSGEFWLGLESIHQITADNCSSMRIDMTDIYGGTWYAQYEYFHVSDADSGFVLQVSGFVGNASDAFEYQNHMEFSTVDRDRDISNTHCAGNYEGGWWYSHCQHVNINGKYTLGLTWFDSARNEWIAVAATEMRLFRRADCG